MRWGATTTSSAFAGESLTNLVHRRVLMPEGPTFVSRRGEHDREFLAAADPWFHPVYLTTGPDGALYVVDFYRRWVEHPAFVAESVRGDVDWREGAGHGRIWKVSRRENTWPPRPQPRLASAATADLVAQLESTNGWRRDTAHRLLVERRDPQATPLLRSLLADSRLPQAKVHALSVLHALGELHDSLLVRGLEAGEAHVRQFALRLAAPRIASSPALRESILAMTDFPSPLVRFQLALAMAEVEGPEKVASLVKLADRECGDPAISAAIVGSLGTSAADFLAELVHVRSEWPANPDEDQMRVLREAAVAVVGAGNSDQLRATFLLISPEKAESVTPGDLAILAGLAQALTARGHALRAMIDAPPEGLRPYVPTLKRLIAAARTIAAADNESLGHRLEAVEVLGLLDSASGPVLLGLVEPVHPQPLQSAAAAALAQADAATAADMFSKWHETTTATRRALVDAALRSSITTAALIDAVEQSQILPRELEPTTRDALFAVRDPALESRIKKLLQSQASRAQPRRSRGPLHRGTRDRRRPGPRRGPVRKALPRVSHRSDARTTRGAGPVGRRGSGPRVAAGRPVRSQPAGVARVRGLHALNARGASAQRRVGIGNRHQRHAAPGRRAQDFVLREQIEELRSTGKSLMPDGMEENLSEQDVADLLAFLAQPNAHSFSKPK